MSHALRDLVLYQRSLILTRLTAGPLTARWARAAPWCEHHNLPSPKRASRRRELRLRAGRAVRNAASGQRHAACGGAKWPPGGVAALARPVLRSSGAAAAEGGCFCIAQGVRLGAAPSQEAISPPSSGSILRTFGISEHLHPIPANPARLELTLLRSNSAEAHHRQ